MVQLGIASPVTKDTAGSRYHDELSRQLSDWLTKRALKMHGGVMLTTDLYWYEKHTKSNTKNKTNSSFCLFVCRTNVVADSMFNRARGTEMVSPDDLMRACLLFDKLKLPVRLKKFDSGVQVVLSASDSDEAVAKRMGKEVQVSQQLSKIMWQIANRSLCLCVCEIDSWASVGFFFVSGVGDSADFGSRTAGTG